MATLTNIQAITDALKIAMRRDDRVVVLGEDVGKLGGVFRATQGLQKEFGVERVIDTPLAEAGIVGTAVGMAIFGMRPVAEIQFDGFLLPALNQLIAHAARMRNRTRSRFHVPLVVRVPWGGGIHAPEHHSDSIEAILAHTPGLKIVMPSTPYDMKGLLLAAIEDPDPVLFLEHKRIYRAVKGEVPEDFYTIPIGKAQVIREGTDVTLIGWGFTRHLCVRVAEQFVPHSVSAEVIDLRTITPWDEETVLASVTKTGRIVIVQEAARQCGLGAEIAAVVAERTMFSLKGPIERVTGYDITMPLPKAEKLNIPDERRVMAAVERVMQY